MDKYSASLVTTQPMRIDANKLAVALGYDKWPGKTYSVPLSATGAEPATHYGCHTWATQQFVDVLAEAGAGGLPPIPWEQFELTGERVLEIVDALSSDIVLGGNPADTFAAASEKAGVQMQDTND